MSPLLGVCTSIGVDMSKRPSWFKLFGFRRFSYLGFLVVRPLRSFCLLLSLGTAGDGFPIVVEGSTLLWGLWSVTWFSSPSDWDFSLPSPG